jgi:pyruvate dehydrogenase E2 component (dihydrolipoamide acetyltransferase)
MSKQTAPHFYLNMDVDMSGVEARRMALKRQASEPVPSINDFILRAVAQALAESPSMNAAWTEAGIEQFNEVNLGVAVAVEDGLVVPVIRHADRLGLDELAQLSSELADRAQERKLKPADYQGGTFTVSNLGMFGVDSFTAIINPPQCAILAVGRVAPRVVPHAGDIAVRPMMTMTLSADHRVVDGAIGARFLQRVKQRLEET